MVWHIQLTGLSAVNNLDRVRYASMVGHKIGTNYQIRFLEIKIDEYDSELYNIYYNFHTKEENKKQACSLSFENFRDCKGLLFQAYPLGPTLPRPSLHGMQRL